MRATQFRTSKVVTVNGLSYVAIAENMDKLLPDWAPAREVAFALNSLLQRHYGDRICECQEGIYESELSVTELEAELRRCNFAHKAVLDPVIEDFQRDME